MQVASAEDLQALLDVACECEKRKDAVWSVPKCAYIGIGSGNGQTTVHLDGQRLKPGIKET